MIKSESIVMLEYGRRDMYCRTISAFSWIDCDKAKKDPWQLGPA